MEKRLIIAIALAVLIIVSFQYFVAKPTPGVSPAPQTAAVAQPVSPVAQYEPPKNLPPEKETTLSTEKLTVTFSNIGGAIKDIQLNEYTKLNSKERLDLVQIKNPKEYIFNLNNLTTGQVLDIADYSARVDGLTITYTTNVKDYEIKKKYTLHNASHAIELELSIKNTSSDTKDFSYSLIGGSGLTEKSLQDKRLIDVTAKIDGKKVGFRRPKPGERTSNIGIMGWQALKNKYFSVILKPFISTRSGFYTEDAEGNLIMGVDSGNIAIEPGSKIEQKYSLYVGPSSISTLREFGHGIEETIDYGIFGGISKALIAVLKFCHMIFKNWGLSIILLSVLLNILLFPLTAKSFKSMQKMQELHPQMEKLKVQLKDNPQKLNKEIMELYKKYNINPFSGCLPILLQMPIFIALYQALMKSIELRNAGFLWIRDLSSPEAIPLPISFPIIGDSINILPLVMVAVMVIQQKMSTKSMGGAVSEEQKQQQKIMLIVMPIMFGFIFYNMPSGLVLYWVVNTALTIVEQAAVLKKA